MNNRVSLQYRTNDTVAPGPTVKVPKTIKGMIQVSRIPVSLSIFETRRYAHDRLETEMIIKSYCKNSQGPLMRTLWPVPCGPLNKWGRYIRMKRKEGSPENEIVAIT